MNHLISLKEQSKQDILKILDLAQKIKAEKKAVKYLDGKVLIMLFQKNSTRTRLSFEVAMAQLGGHAIFLDDKTTNFALTDFNDEMKVLMRYSDALMFRAKKTRDIEQAAALNQIPVIDGCSEKYHPTQTLADLLTMAEHSGGIDKIKKVVWLGVENNVSNTLVLACAKLGINVTIVAPEADPNSIDDELNKQAESTGLITRTLDLKQGLKNADYVHTDTWMNMEFFDENGKTKPKHKAEHERRKKLFKPYQLNAKLIDTYAPKAKIMHCMPCHVGYEISRDAIDHPNSIVFDQAENRLHVNKGVLVWIMN